MGLVMEQPIEFKIKAYKTRMKISQELLKRDLIIKAKLDHRINVLKDDIECYQFKINKLEDGE